MAKKRTSVVTGATNGVGLAVARHLAEKGDRVVVVARNAERAAVAKNAIVAETPAAEVIVAIGDLELQSGVRAVADTILASVPTIDVLINNAAVVTGTRREVTAEGLERTWATNVLAYHLLTNLLLPRIVESAPARIINVVSDMAYGLDISDPQYVRRRFHRTDAYAQSKQADRMLTWSLSRRLRSSGVVVNAANPGGIRTGLRRNVRGLRRLLLARSEKRYASPDEGADTPVWLATSPDLRGISGVMFLRRQAVVCPYRDPEQLKWLDRICESMWPTKPI